MMALTDAQAIVLAASIPATLALIGTWLSGRSTKRATRKVIEPLAQAMDTQNEKHLATYVHDMAGTVELIQTQQRMNMHEMTEVRHLALQTRDYITDHLNLHNEVLRAQLDGIITKLDEHMAGTEPLILRFLEEHPDLDPRREVDGS